MIVTTPLAIMDSVTADLVYDDVTGAIVSVVVKNPDGLKCECAIISPIVGRVPVSIDTHEMTLTLGADAKLARRVRPDLTEVFELADGVAISIVLG